MNNKGFTLVEIIVVVALLGIIMSLSISSYVNYSEKLEERNKENSISIIKMKAKDYYNSTGKNVFFVKELLQKGYLKGNQSNKYIVNSDDYTCHIVNVESSTDENNKININVYVNEEDYSLIEQDEEGYINCDNSKINDLFSLSLNNNIVSSNIPGNSSITILSNLGDYTHQENNSDNKKEITMEIKNINNIQSDKDNDFLIVISATLVTNENKIVTKKISVFRSNINK